MPIPADRRRSFLARQVATMALSHVSVDSPMGPVRAASWANAMYRLGIHLPLFLVHDIGMLFTTAQGPTGWTIGARKAVLASVSPPAPVRGLLEQYVELLHNIASSEVVQKVAGWRVRDELVAILLSRALGDTYNRWQDRSKAAGVEELPLDLGLYSDVDPADHFRDFDPQPLWAFIEHLVAQSLHIYTSIELIDLDTVRLLGMFKEDTAHAEGGHGRRNRPR